MISMADTITIPSPRVFLTASPVIESQDPPPKPAPAKPKQPRKRNTAASKAKAGIEKSGETNANGVEKKKQSKSRNGCITCKAKRLKCDETKPTCQQCARRNVECGGYRKDYKWRPFGETNFTIGRPPGSSKPKKDVIAQHGPLVTPSHSNSPTELAPAGVRTPISADGREELQSDTQDGKDLKLRISVQEMDSDANVSPDSFTFDEAMAGFPPLSNMVGIDNDDMMALSADDTKMSLQDFDAPLFTEAETATTTTAIMGFDHNISGPMLTPMSMDQSFFPDEDDVVEEVMRNHIGGMDQEPWMMQLVSNSAIGSMFPDTDGIGLPRGIDFAMDGPEMLTMRFDRQTCGILSVKDGPTENPWRTLIWPLARDSPALYHAIASMTSFHTSQNQPELRVQGIDHMRTSIEALATGIANMRFDTAIATTLALAFAESWDQHTSTGINHIKGAKILVNQALTRHHQVAFAGEELERLKFLCNAWVYMDVLARLTSEDDDESNDFDAVYSKLAEPFQGESHLDPLMGAASTLFPIIGRVANLVRRVRRCKSNSPAVISHAMELKTMLQDWDPPILDEIPEDPSIDTGHTVQTAEAYRWATLLYLHQAVPEIPSESSTELGKKVMVLLATVPLSSRTVIVHIYPLIAASCEATDEEDRQWVRERWRSMASRMKIGVIDRCGDVVQEVWDRRDQHELQKVPKHIPLKRGLSLDFEGNVVSECDFEWNDPFEGRKRRATNGAFDNPRTMQISCTRKTSRDAASGEIDHDFTVRGRLHWLGVMKDWGWEVLLG